VLSWSSFCRDAFLLNNTLITIVDQGKFNWKCTMQFGEEDNRMVCKIGGDWRAMCLAQVWRRSCYKAWDQWGIWR
jgi:hypothetical protein